MPNTHVPAAGEAVLAAETPHDELRRLSWRIAELLNDLDPRIDYVTIRASSVGSHAVMTGFDIPLPGEDDIQPLFQRWKDAELRGDLAEVDDDPVFDEYRALQNQIVSRRPVTAQDVAIAFIVGTDRWTSTVGADLKTLAASLVGETEGM